MKKLLIPIVMLLVIFSACSKEEIAKETAITENETDEIQSATQINSDNALPQISIVLEEKSCAKNNSFAKFKVLKDNEPIDDIVVDNCLSTEVQIITGDKNNAYFSILPESIGGYILYGKYTNLFRLKFTDNTLTALIEDTFTDIDITPMQDRITYKTQTNLIVKNIENNEETVYKFPVKDEEAQIGDFKFSPKSDKIAIAVGYGPENERGEIYILDLISEEYSLYKKIPQIPRINGWINDEELSID